jgi:hypothetical protein
MPDTGRGPAAVGTAGPATTTASGATTSAGAETASAVGLAGAAEPQPAALAAAGSPASATPPLVVTLKATGRSWVAATADGTRILYRTLEPGATETLRASREITIRVGNAGGLTWSVNGREGEVMGGPGEVRTVRLTR